MSASASGVPSRDRLLFARVFLLVGLPLLAYLPGFNSQFHLDDWPIVRNNSYLNINSLSPAVLLKAAFQDFGNNRPLVNVSLALNYYFSAQASVKDLVPEPFSYHLVNFLVLIFTAFGVWLALQKLFSRLGFDTSRSGWAGWAAALLWACHPVNVQAITYVVQRYASMAGAFSIWSIYFFHLGFEKQARNRRYYFLGSLFCLFALLSKENAAVLPALIFIYKLYFIDGLKPGWLKRNRIAVFSLLVFYGLAAAVMLRPSMLETAFDFSRQPFSARERFLTEPRALLWYPMIVIFPFPQYLSLLHYFSVSRSLFHPPQTAVAFSVIYGVIFLAVFRAREWKTFSFAVLWYFGQLLVESLPLPIEFAHEHRLYLAQLSIIAPAAAWPLLKTRRLPLALVWVIAIAVFISIFTFQRNTAFVSEKSLWRDTLQKAPEFSVLPWKMCCLAMMNKAQYYQANPICRKAAQIAPGDFEVVNNLGASYLQLGRVLPAQKEFLAAQSLQPKNPGVTFNLGLTYIIQNDWANAAKWFRETIALTPGNPAAHYNLAISLRELKDEDGYLQELYLALELNPAYKDVAAELALALARKGKCREALQLAGSRPEPDPRFEKAREYCQPRKN